jgi:hypothetical protein
LRIYFVSEEAKRLLAETLQHFGVGPLWV